MKKRHIEINKALSRFSSDAADASCHICFGVLPGSQMSQGVTGLFKKKTICGVQNCCRPNFTVHCFMWFIHSYWWIEGKWTKMHKIWRVLVIRCTLYGEGSTFRSQTQTCAAKFVYHLVVCPIICQPDRVVVAWGKCHLVVAAITVQKPSHTQTQSLWTHLCSRVLLTFSCVHHG